MTSRKRIEKFFQPDEGITVVKRGSTDTLLSDEIIEQARQRALAGEDLEAVALELAQMEVDFLDPDMEEVRAEGTEDE